MQTVFVWKKLGPVVVAFVGSCIMSGPLGMMSLIGIDLVSKQCMIIMLSFVTVRLILAVRTGPSLAGNDGA